MKNKSSKKFAILKCKTGICFNKFVFSLFTTQTATTNIYILPLIYCYYIMIRNFYSFLYCTIYIIYNLDHNTEYSALGTYRISTLTSFCIKYS